MKLKVALVAITLVSFGALLLVGPGRLTSADAARSEADARRESRAALSSEASTFADTTTTSTTTQRRVEAGNQDVLATAIELVGGPTNAGVREAALAMAATGDAGWVPYLVDMVRLLGGSRTLEALQTALADLTGVEAPADAGETYLVYGAWMHNEEPRPVPGYIEWKATLYGLVDFGFESLIAQVEDPILASQLQWGGVGVGGIPELNEPEIISVTAADYMTPDELTFGAVINGEVRSFPHRILDHHELANDVLGGEPVALANCTLCRTGVLFSRRVGTEILEFETSGLLRNSNKVMVDRQTGTLWNQLTGEAIAGPLVGTVLDRFPITVTTFGDWVEEHPDTQVVAIPGFRAFSYEPGEAYSNYYGTDQLWFPVGDVPDAFAEKDLVATLDLEGNRFAVGVDALTDAGPRSFTVGPFAVVAVPTSGGARFYGPAGGRLDDGPVEVEAGDEETVTLADGTELPRLKSGHSFWFAWFSNFSDTGWWPASP